MLNMFKSINLYSNKLQGEIGPRWEPRNCHVLSTADTHLKPLIFCAGRWRSKHPQTDGHSLGHWFQRGDGTGTRGGDFR